MFTLEESALLRRMLQVLVWVAIGLALVGALLAVRPWRYFL